MEQEIYKLGEQARKMSATMNVYDDFVNTISKSEIEKENILIKLQLLRDEILKSNMNIKTIVAKLNEEIFVEDLEF